MPADDTNLTNLSRIWRLMPVRRKRQLVLVALLLIAGVLAEAVTITMVIPLVSVMAAPEEVRQMIGPIVELLGIETDAQLRIALVIIFIGLAFASAGIRLFYLWASMKFAFAVGADFTERAFLGTLLQPYIEQVRINSSHLLTGLMVKMQAVVFSGLIPFLSAVGALALAIVILGTLFVITPKVTLILLGMTVILGGLVVMLLRAPLARIGRKIAIIQPQFTEQMQVARGGIREIILDGTQAFFANELSRIQRELRSLQAMNGFLGGAPRFLMETVFLLIMIGIAYWTFSTAADPLAALPGLSVIALGAMKILPAAQMLLLNWATIRANAPVVSDALDLVEIRTIGESLPVQERGDAHPLPFEREIALRDIWFRYGDNEPWILSGIDLEIPKGARIGIVGQTGSGKSTLIDLIMGLLTPSRGHIEVDGIPLHGTTQRAWGKQVAHVPQNIYLTDASAATNIAFGIPTSKIDKERVSNAAHKARIGSFVGDGDHGFATYVGERGIRISGGQRQRIGIARALYKEAELIVLDEATSALDSDTEAEIMKTICDLGRDKTIIMIAHRITTLKECDRIIELEHGQIARVCSYDEL